MYDIRRKGKKKKDLRYRRYTPMRTRGRSYTHSRTQTRTVTALYATILASGLLENATQSNPINLIHLFTLNLFPKLRVELNKKRVKGKIDVSLDILFSKQKFTIHKFLLTNVVYASH